MARRKNRPHQQASSRDFETERRNKTRRENQMHLEAEFEATPDHPSWYHQLASIMRMKDTRSMPKPQDFDYALAELTEEENTQPIQTFDQILNDVLEREITTTREQWHLDVMARLQTARKRELGPEGLQRIQSAKQLPRWFWKYREPDVLTPGDLMDFDDDISQLNDECVCVEQGPSACHFHQAYCPEVRQSIPMEMRELFVERSAQREQRKINKALNLPRWWCALLKRHTNRQRRSWTDDELGIDDFEDDMSDIDDGCGCEGCLKDTCMFHHLAIIDIEETKHRPSGFVVAWKARENAKLYFRAREARQARYQENLEAEEAHHKKKHSKAPKKFPWFRRVSAVMSKEVFRNQRVDEYSKYEPPYPSPELFDEDLSEAAFSELDEDEEDLAARLCGCNEEVDDCDCGAAEDDEDGQLEHLKPSSDGDESDNFRFWQKLRAERKREIKAIKEEAEEEDEFATVLHQLYKTEVAQAYANATKKGDVSRPVDVSVFKVRLYKLYPPEHIASLIYKTKRSQDYCSMTVKTLENKGKGRCFVHIYVCFGVDNNWWTKCWLSRVSYPVVKLLNFTEGREEDDVGKSVKALEVTFIGAHYARIAVPMSVLTNRPTETFNSDGEADSESDADSDEYFDNGEESSDVGDEDSIHDEGDSSEEADGSYSEEDAIREEAPTSGGSGMLDRVVFDAISHDAPTEVARRKQKQKDKEDRQRTARSHSPRDNWFNNNHPMGAFNEWY